MTHRWSFLSFDLLSYRYPHINQAAKMARKSSVIIMHFALLNWFHASKKHQRTNFLCYSIQLQAYDNLTENCIENAIYMSSQEQTSKS